MTTRPSTPTFDDEEVKEVKRTDFKRLSDLKEPEEPLEIPDGTMQELLGFIDKFRSDVSTLVKKTKKVEKDKLDSKSQQLPPFPTI